MRILIVDDNRDIRLLLSKVLSKWGHETIIAADGAQAWEVLKTQEVYLVLTDWLMPEMDGLELCRRIRAADFRQYVYIIMLTAKDSENELIEGMEAGADDFMVKPFKKDELKVRIRAGERVIRLQQDLAERNEKLSEANRVMKKDLEAAARVQASLLPQPLSIVQGVRFGWMFFPSTFVAGDTLNYFKLDENHVGFYLIDVAGHGIPAALLSVTLTNVLSPADILNSPLKKSIPSPPHYEIVSPAQAVRTLNERFQADEETMQYFTMVYGVMDTRDGKTLLTQAGHPHPAFLKKGGQAGLVGEGGFPVGLFPDVDYEEIEFQIGPGDRLFLYSDGITECSNNRDEHFSTDRLLGLLERGADLPLPEAMKEIEKRLRLFRGKDEFADDVTLLGLEMV